jgi:hypothetical protein
MSSLSSSFPSNAGKRWASAASAAILEDGVGSSCSGHSGVIDTGMTESGSHSGKNQILAGGSRTEGDGGTRILRREGALNVGRVYRVYQVH